MYIEAKVSICEGTNPICSIDRSRTSAMAWVDGHERPKRLRMDVWDGFENDWTVEVAYATPNITLSKGGHTVAFTIEANYPFEAPSVELNGRGWRLPPTAWEPALSLAAYAERVVQHAALLQSISLPPRGPVPNR